MESEHSIQIQKENAEDHGGGSAADYNPDPTGNIPIQVQLESEEDLEGKIGMAFSWQDPYYSAWYEQYPVRQYASKEILAAHSAMTHDYKIVRSGQNMAVLEGFTSTPVVNGTMQFNDLKVVTATSPNVFINFIVGSAVTSWNAASRFGLDAGQWPHPLYEQRGVMLPITLQTDISDVSIMRFGQAYSSADAPQMTVTEGQIMPNVTIKVTKTSGTTVGVRVLAFFVEAAGIRYPNDYEPNLATQGPRLSGRPVTKKLYNVMSEPCDADGLCKFNNLKIGYSGAAGLHKIRFAAEGVQTASTLPVNIATAVDHLRVSVQPGTIPMIGVTPPSASATSSYADANVVVLDQNGAGITGKNATVRLVAGNNKDLVIPKELVNVMIVPMVETYNAQQELSDESGNLRIPLRFTHYNTNNADIQATGAYGGVRAIFTVDGKDSYPTNLLQFDTTTAGTYEGQCTSIVVESAPQSVLETPFAEFSATVRALDATGQPVSGVNLYPALLRNFKRAPELFKVGVTSNCTDKLRDRVQRGLDLHDFHSLPTEYCNALHINDNIMYSSYKETLKNLDKSSLYQDQIKVLDTDYGSVYDHQTDADGRVTLPAWMVAGANGTMFLEFRGTDYGCRSEPVQIQVISHVHSVEFKTSYKGATEGSTYTGATDPMSEFLAETYDDVNTDHFNQTDLAFWPWDNVSHQFRWGKTLVKDRYGQPLSGQYVDFEYVSVPNNFWSAFPWELMQFDVFLSDISTCPNATEAKNLAPRPGCKQARYHQGAGMMTSIFVGIDPNSMDHSWQTDAAGSMSLWGGINDIRGTGGYDMLMSANAKVQPALEMLKIRFENPIESIEWRRQPTEDPTGHALALYQATNCSSVTGGCSSKLATGEPFKSAPYAWLNLKVAYQGIKALQCSNLIPSDENTIYPEGSHGMGNPLDSLNCNSRDFPFFIQRAPVHAYLETDSPNSAAFADVYNNQAYGVQMNAFPHGPNADKWNDFKDMYVASNTGSARLSVRMSLSYVKHNTRGYRDYDFMRSDPSSQVCMKGDSDPAAVQGRVKTQPSTKVALGTYLPVPPKIEYLIPYNNDTNSSDDPNNANVQWQNLDVIASVLPASNDGTPVLAKKRWKTGNQQLSGNVCQYKAGMLISGRCTPTTLQRTDKGKFKSVEIEFTGLKWVEGKAGAQTILSVYGPLNLGMQKPLSMLQDTQDTLNMKQMTLSKHPTEVSVVQDPPSTVHVHEVFMVSCVARVDGAALKDHELKLAVTKQVTMQSAITNGADFVNQLSASEPPKPDASLPTFQEGTDSARTDEFGVARFLVSFKTGNRKTTSYALYCESATGVKSKKSTAMEVVNAVKNVTAVVEQEATLTDSIEHSFRNYPGNVTLGPFFITAAVDTAQLGFPDNFGNYTKDEATSLIAKSIDWVLVDEYDYEDIKPVLEKVNKSTAKSVATTQATYFAVQANITATQQKCADAATEATSLTIQLQSCVPPNPNSNSSFCSNATQRAAAACRLNSLEDFTRGCPSVLDQLQTEAVGLKHKYDTAIQAAYVEAATKPSGLKSNAEDLSYMVKLVTQSSKSVKEASKPATAAKIVNWTQPTNIVGIDGRSVELRRSILGSQLQYVTMEVPSVTLEAKSSGRFILFPRVSGVAAKATNSSSRRDDTRRGSHSGISVNLDTQGKPDCLLPDASDSQQDTGSGIAGGFIKIFRQLLLLAMALAILSGTHNLVPLGVSLCASLLAIFYAIVLIQCGVVRGGMDQGQVLEVACLIVCVLLYVFMFCNAFRDRNKKIGDDDAHDFTSTQLQAWRAYVKRLVTPVPPSPEIQALQIAVDAQAEHTWEDATAEQDLQNQILAEKEAWQKEMESPIYHIKEILKSVTKGTNDAAFFFPQKVFAAAFISIVTNIFLLIQTKSWVHDWYTYFKDDIRSQTSWQLYKGMQSVQEQYYSAMGVDLDASYNEDMYHQAAQLNDALLSLADALWSSFIMASIISTLFYALTLPWHMASIRMQVLMARRGMWESWFACQARAKATVVYTVYYMPEIITNFGFTYMFVIILLTPIGIILFWEKLRNYLLTTVYLMLGSLIFTFINMALMMSVIMKSCEKDRLKHRRIFLMFDFYQNMFGIIASVVGALMRLIMGVVMLILGLFRMEVAITPSWLNTGLVQLDKPSRATGAVVFMIHTHMNPVLRTFVYLVNKEFEQHNSHEMNEADKLSGQRRRRALRRWKFTIYLAQNPWLIPLRKHNLAPEYDEEEEEVEAKEGLKDKLMKKLANMRKKKGAEEEDGAVQWYRGGEEVPTKEEPVKEKKGLFGRKKKGEQADETVNPLNEEMELEDIPQNDPPAWSQHTWRNMKQDLKPKKKEKTPEDDPENGDSV
jgi:hypothetical protein